jgi:hypothetical protein
MAKRPGESHSHKRETRKNEDSELYLTYIDIRTVGTWEQTSVWRCVPGICCLPDMKLWSGLCCSIDDLNITKVTINNKTNITTTRTEGYTLIEKISCNQKVLYK